MTEEKVLPELRLFVIDETKYYDERFQAECGGKIEAVFIFDANRHVHCCEITPSYEMEYLYSVANVQTEDDEERDRIHSELDEANINRDLVEYRHVRSVKLDKCEVLTQPTPEEWDELLEEHEGEDDPKETAYRAWMEKQREYYNGNTPY